MNSHELMHRCQAIGVTFQETEHGDIVGEGPISDTMADFIRDNTPEILAALRSNHRVIDLQVERARRRPVSLRERRRNFPPNGAA
ncbi:MAG: hypothetical protein H0T72_07150 [Chloroflexia bacterium]|nr:hypothetical protein [Chloroflexia bacterium]